MSLPILGRRACISLFVSVLTVCSAQPAVSQVSFGDSSGTTTLSAPPDYATEVLQNPWDFSSDSDLGNYVKAADTSGNITIDSGNLTAPPASFFHMVSPAVCDANPSGKTGPAFSIDTTRYRYLTFRAYSSEVNGLNVHAFTGCNYFENFWRSESFFVQPGWGVYTVDLQTINRTVGISTPWNGVPATGLRLDVIVKPVVFDWMTLTGEGGDSAAVNYSRNSGGTTKLYSMFLDEDTNPLNGFDRVLVQTSDTTPAVNLSARSLYPGSTYRVVAVQSNDFPALIPDPWDMAEITDVENLTSTRASLVSDGISFAPQASTSSFDLAVHRKTIPGNKFRYLRLDMTLAQAANVSVKFVTGGGTVSAATFSGIAGRQTFSLDLGAVSGWSTTIDRLVVQLSGLGAVTLHQASLRNDGFGVADVSPQTIISPRAYHANAAPRVALTQPDAAGGADFAAQELGNPWNMDDTSDFVNLFSIRSPRILPNNVVDGVSGNFFAGSSLPNDYDPHAESLNTIDRRTATIDTGRYKNLTYRLKIDAPQDIVLGSVARIVWRVESEAALSFYNGDDTVTFDGWNTYVQDMRSIKLEHLQHPPGSFPAQPWYGRISQFRVDPHEFSTPTAFYFDYIRVTADDEANSQFLVTLDVDDVDSNPSQVSASVFYTTTASTSGGTLIGSFTLDQAPHVIWDTRQVPDGSYYIYAVVSDGQNSTSRLATGKVVVNHSRAQDTTPPNLVVDNPGAGATVYDTAVLAGYALDDIQLAKIDVLVDDVWLTSLQPGLFDARAQALYRSFAESGNAGFRSTVSFATIAAGPHTLTLRAWDTAGNVTSSEVMQFTRVIGADPSPYPSPAPGSDPPIEIPIGALMSLSSSANIRTGDLTVRIRRGKGCGTIALYGTTRRNLTDVSRMTRLGAKSGVTGVSLRARALRPFVGPKGEQIVVVATCDDSIRRTKALTLNRFPGKKVTKSSSWLRTLKRKMAPLAG
ncbi:MAG: hypothetical protein RL518_1073 [Pseudomonadota bacterium]